MSTNSVISSQMPSPNPKLLTLNQGPVKLLCRPVQHHAKVAALPLAECTEDWGQGINVWGWGVGSKAALRGTWLASTGAIFSSTLQSWYSFSSTCGMKFCMLNLEFSSRPTETRLISSAFLRAPNSPM